MLDQGVLQMLEPPGTYEPSGRHEARTGSHGQGAGAGPRAAAPGGGGGARVKNRYLGIMSEPGTAAEWISSERLA